MDAMSPRHSIPKTGQEFGLFTGSLCDPCTVMTSRVTTLRDIDGRLSGTIRYGFHRPDDDDDDDYTVLLLI